MANGNVLVPTSVFPVALDTDYTLFLTFDSTQSILAEDISPESTEIPIVPCLPDEQEVWPENGFVTIDDELIYYDAAEKNENGKISKLLNCLRHLEGIATSATAGTAVFGMVVAQHHNQLADAIVNIEKTLGQLQEAEGLPALHRQALLGSHASETMSLHNSMVSLMGAAPAADDICPDVSFTFTEISPGLAEYCVRISGDFTFYQLDFGDGNFTNDTFEGLYSYTSPSIAPSVTVINQGCTIILTPETPQPGCDVTDITPPAVSFGVPIPDAPEFPEFIVPKQICPGPLLTLPPIAQPCVQLSMCNCASTISQASTSCAGLGRILVSLVGCCVPSKISIVGCCPPSKISYVGCCPPSQISLIGCCLPSIISFAPPPKISVSWGTPPVVSCVVLIKCPSFTPCTQTGNSTGLTGTHFGAAPLGWEDHFHDAFPADEMAPEDFGIPREIKVIAPHIPDMKLVHNIPEKIQVEGQPIPEMVRVIGPATPIPQEIKLVAPETINVVADIPRIISVDASDIPRKIIVEAAPNFPSILKVDMPDTLKVVGIPSAIELIGNIPSFIQLVMPENPVVEMRYTGAPPEFKVVLDPSKLIEAGLAIVPTNK